MAGKGKKSDEESREQQEHGAEGTQRSRFGGTPQPVQAEDVDREEVDQDPGDRQKRNQGDIEEDKLAS